MCKSHYFKLGRWNFQYLFIFDQPKCLLTNMRKIHLGCGERKYIGWENYDREIDMRNPLPFEDNSIDYFLQTMH